MLGFSNSGTGRVGLPTFPGWSPERTEAFYAVHAAHGPQGVTCCTANDVERSFVAPDAAAAKPNQPQAKKAHGSTLCRQVHQH